MNSGKMKINLLLFILFLIMVSSCRKDTQKLIDCQENKLYQLAGFNVGVAVVPDLLFGNEKYNQVVKNQFNSITPEYVMKPSYIHPSENVFYWKDADQLVDYCQIQNKSLHGHTLIWHKQLPFWMENYTGDWHAMFKNHITTIVGRYKGRVKAWDVVNEAFEDDGSLRNTIWKQKIGENYIALAFQYAHQADPQALLFYNDYSLETKADKMKAVLKMASDFKATGVPIHGIGLQMHVSYDYPTNRLIESTLNCFCETGLKIHVSELDVVVNSNKNLESPTFHLMKEQKKRVKTIVEAYNKLPIENKYGISLWGVSDANTWVRKEYNRNDWPLLYDDDYQIKPCYCGFIEGLEK